eukprot:Em0012g689a
MSEKEGSSSDNGSGGDKQAVEKGKRLPLVQNRVSRARISLLVRHRSIGLLARHRSIGLLVRHRSIGLVVRHRSSGLLVRHRSIGRLVRHRIIGLLGKHRSIGLLRETPVWHRRNSPRDSRTSGQYNPATALPPKLARRIADLEFVEMSDLLPDSWQEETQTLIVFDTQLNPRRLGRKAAIQDISQWVKCYSKMAAVLSARYPEKAPELWAYQASIFRAARNFEGSRPKLVTAVHPSIQ